MCAEILSACDNVKRKVLERSHSKMSRLTARIASPAACACTTYAKCRAICLYMAEALTMVTLLGYVNDNKSILLSVERGASKITYCQ